MPTWDADQYLLYNDQRTRPCRELAARISVESPKTAIDLGCGPGNSTAVLMERWPQTELTGLDSSPEMIAAAKKSHPQIQWQIADIAAWAGQTAFGERSRTACAFDIVFSNAALQWVDNHPATFPRLLHRVAPGGALAVQMPGNYDSPAHQIMRDLAQSPRWRPHLPPKGIREWHVHSLPDYYDILDPNAASVDLWETEYLHVMSDAAAIVEWYKGTGLRPFLDALAGEELRAEFLAEYKREISRAYQKRGDGKVVFPFRRLFMIAYQRPA
jgi:trans-aconitate 2-methyltransferase